MWAAINKSASATVGLLLASGACVGTIDTDGAIERGFASVIAQRVDTPRMSQTLIAGTEDYWLRQSTGASTSLTGGTELEHVVWQGPVAAGGKLVIGSGSTRKELAVISIEEKAAEQSTRIDMSMPSAEPLRVEARDGQDVTAPSQWFELTRSKPVTREAVANQTFVPPQAADHAL